MAIKIDNDLLQEIGLSTLPDPEKNSLLKHIYETLEMRVGMRLADQMTNEQLDEFEQYFEAKDDAGAFKWLETNFPNYKEIVQQEFDKLKVEVAQSAPQILAASQQAQVAPATVQNPQLQPAPQNPGAPAPPAQPAVYSQPAMPTQPPQPYQPQPVDPGFQPQAAPAPAQPYAAPQAPVPDPNPVPQQPAAPTWQPPTPDSTAQPPIDPQQPQYPGQQPAPGPGPQPQ